MPEFSNRILSWYSNHARVLAWRGVEDPYAIWVSEIMLQQTRVETVIPYYERWMRLFPTIQALADAPQQSVLSAWEGLGYYARVRNLQKAAQIVVHSFEGNFPHEIKQMQELPGIGRYTAAAIASIAFGQDVATLDGNLRRVFARVFDVSIRADTPAGQKILWGLAQEQLPVGRAGDYNQALMDLGSSICLPKKPLCLLCPLNDLCESRCNPESRPVLKPKATVPHRFKMAAVVERDGNFLMALRPASGLLGGLWEFPAIEVETFEPDSLAAGMRAVYGIEIEMSAFLAEIHHAYTHFTLTERAWRCSLAKPIANFALQWIPQAELSAYPMGKVDRAISTEIIKR